MGLLDWVKNQLNDVIEWTDDSPNTLVWRFPRAGNEIKNGAQLIVREGQVAVFVHEGQIGDVFKPGRVQLTTANIPVLTSLSALLVVLALSIAIFLLRMAAGRSSAGNAVWKST